MQHSQYLPSRTCHGTRQFWLAPTPQTWTAPSSSPRRVRYGLSGFCWCGCTTGCWGRGGGCGWTGGGGVVHLDKSLRLGVVDGSRGWQRELLGPGKRWGEVGDPPEMGVKMFELAQTNFFTPERKKGGGGHPLAIRRPLLTGQCKLCRASPCA